MEREGEFKRGDRRDRFAGRNLMSSVFGRGFRQDPFDDPFFTRPFGSLFGPSMFETRSDDPVAAPAANRPVIRAINSDGEEEEEEEEEENVGDAKDKDSLAENKVSDVVKRNDGQKMDDEEMQQVKSRSFCYRKVTYGGVDGIYRTSTVSRRAGGDGVMLEESKAADLTTGQAEHRISRGIQNKGHSVTRLLKPDGKVETMQTLHNLNEDELAGFNESWKGTTANEKVGKWRSKEELTKHSSVAEAGGGGWGSTRRSCDKKMSPVVAPDTSAPKKVIRIPIE